MRTRTKVMAIAALVLTVAAGAVAVELMTSERLALALIEAHPEIDPEQHVFLAWKGLEVKEMNQFDLVLLVKEEKIFAVTESPKLITIFEDKKKRKWSLVKNASGQAILSFKKPKDSLQEFLEERFGLRILTKTTVTPP